MSGSSQPIIHRPVVSALALISAAQFVLQLNFSIVTVALPTIQRELGFAAADLQWLVKGYALTFGSLLLLGGRLGDLQGRRRLLVLGLVLFGLATLAAARTAQTGSLASGYGFSFLVAIGIALLALVLVATQLNHQACQAELARQREESARATTDVPVRKEQI